MPILALRDTFSYRHHLHNAELKRARDKKKGNVQRDLKDMQLCFSQQ